MKKRFGAIFIVICIILMEVFITKKITFANTKSDKSKIVYTGKGIKVAIIDTGVDMSHEDLKNNIIGGYDFIENKKIYKDGDIKTGHGTHVAGIIAANGKIKGVAPEASLLVYRVSSSGFSKDLDKNIILAINRAIKDGAQVINISLKTNIEGPNSELEKVLKKAIDRGIVIVKSNGNYGPTKYTTKGLASSPYVISVGNSTKENFQPVIKSENTIEQVEMQIVDSSKNFSTEKNINIIEVKENEIEEQKEKLKNKIVLVSISKIANIENIAYKIKNAHGKGMIVVNDNEDYWYKFSIMDNEKAVPVSLISNKDGERLKKIIKKGNLYIQNVKLKKIYPESSKGPTKGTWNIKPDISAPGTKILSCTPKSIDVSGYRYNTGTSMAAPYITGVVALIKQAHPSWSVQKIKMAITNNADILKDSYGVPYEPISQGSGLVNIDKAINTESFIMPNNLSFGMVKSKKGKVKITRTLKIENTSKDTKYYYVTILDRDICSSIKINVKSKIKVPSNETVEVPIQLEIDTNNTVNGVYQGRILLEDKNDKKNIPFIVLMDPCDYPLISSLSLGENWLSPNSDNKFDDVEIKYYLPISPDKLRINLVKQNNEENEITIFEESNPKDGYITKKWNGKDLNGKEVEDGAYLIKAQAFYNGRETNIDGDILVLNKKVPKIELENEFLNSDKYIKGTIDGTIIKYDYIFRVLFKQKQIEKKPITLKWSKRGTNIWNDLDISGNKFYYEFKPKDLDEGENNIILKVEDITGNCFCKEIIVKK